ncbi:MAG: membrane dipeptidase [Firmicutes bacterium]|nr:membrane dipeptidase [Bacillota bacterium]MCL2255730.1 membrane dipeptidase [Bacillota bacterium]
MSQFFNSKTSSNFSGRDEGSNLSLTKKFKNIFDLHNDLLTSCEDIKKYEEENSSHKIVLALWTTRMSDPVFEMKKAINFLNCSNKKNLFFAFEDLQFVNETNLEEVLKMPLLYCGLAWRDENFIAGGHKSSIGLTAFGKKVVKALSKKGVKICTSHLNERSFYDVLNMGVKCINSHCGLKEFFYHTRNLSSEQVKMIVQNGGIIGLTPVAEFLKNEKEKPTLEDFSNLVDTFVQNYGIDNIAIGTDFFGAEPLEGLSNYDDFDKLHEMLINRGYKKEDIQKIFFDNANTLVC